MSSKSLLKKLILIIVLTLFGVSQTHIFINLELLWFKPELFPMLNFAYSELEPILIDVASVYAVSLFFLITLKSCKNLEWRLAFLAMIIPYLALKAFGVYYDHTQWMVAAAEGRTIGGGAAFGHLFFLFYLMGPAQFISLVVYFIVRMMRKNKNTHT